MFRLFTSRVTLVVPALVTFALAVLVLVAAIAPLSALAARRDAVTLLYAQSPCTRVYAAPSKSAPLITQLMGGNDVTVVDTTATWTHVLIWGGLGGYIQSSALGSQPPDPALEGDCTFPGLADNQELPLPTGNGPWPLTAQAQVTSAGHVYAQPDGASSVVSPLVAGAGVTISQWAPDSATQPWYHIQAGSATGWVPATSLRLTLPDPATQTAQGAPIWKPIAGKGMWFTNYLPHHSDVAAMMRAAKADGITHVYAEVAISGSGFYANNTLDRLLPAAHAQGIKVLAWVYPTLADVGDDIRVSAQVATYKSPSGDTSDGLAADIEGVNADGLLDSGAVYAYGQALRGLLGANELMVAAVFHPFARPSYPYAALAASFNVLAPMDYWHSHSQRAYSPSDVRRFVMTSITTIRAAMTVSGVGSQLPIEELGQTYNMFTDDFTAGPDAPTYDELTADMRAAKDLGCIGVSYFEWQTATQAQWSALAEFSW
jgi:hypothetical protein